MIDKKKKKENCKTESINMPPVLIKRIHTVRAEEDRTFSKMVCILLQRHFDIVDAKND